MRILILGSYDSSALKKLEMLRHFLLTKGYLQTSLVKEFKIPKKYPNKSQPTYNLRKSEYWIPKADAPIFVFLPNVDNTGPAYELKHLIDKHFDMAWRSIVARSIKPAPKISSLIRGLIQRWSEEIQQVFFNNDNELHKDVRGALTNLLEKLYFPTVDRPKGEWENSK